MGYFAAATDGADTRAGRGLLAAAEDADGPTGTVTGVVTDAGSASRCRASGSDSPATPRSPALGDRLADESDAQGRYTIEHVPAGTYPKLAFFGDAGYNPAARDATSPSAAARPRPRDDMRLVRDWAALNGGATIEAVSDNTGAPFGCGAAQALDQSQGTAWSAVNPSARIPATRTPGRRPWFVRAAADDRRHRSS